MFWRGWAVRAKELRILVGSDFFSNLETIIVKAILVPGNSGHEIGPNTGANATKFFTLATKSWKLVAQLATRMPHHDLP